MEMQSEQLRGNKPSANTQQYLDITEIKEDVVILRDGTLRSVLAVSSINFYLKSEEEQEAIIAAYVQFLNGIDFPMQIVIQSRKLNINGYLQKLKDIEAKQTNELLKIQTTEYRAFIKELVDLGDIMSKHFYVVVPYSPLSDKRKGFFARFKEIFQAVTIVRLKSERFKDMKRNLLLRVEQTRSSLKGMSLEAEMLNTQALIELYYNVYNPDLYETQALADVNKLQLESQ